MNINRGRLSSAKQSQHSHHPDNHADIDAIHAVEAGQHRLAGGWIKCWNAVALVSLIRCLHPSQTQQNAIALPLHNGAAMPTPLPPIKGREQCSNPLDAHRALRVVARVAPLNMRTSGVMSSQRPSPELRVGDVIDIDGGLSTRRQHSGFAGTAALFRPHRERSIRKASHPRRQIVASHLSELVAATRAGSL